MSELNGEFERLLAMAMEGRADERQLDRLRALLRGNRELRAEYAAQLRLHALLQWHAGTASADLEAAEPTTVPFRPAAQSGRPGRLQWWLAAAAAIVAALGAVFWMSQPGRKTQGVQQMAAVDLEVLESTGVVTEDVLEKYREGARLALSRLQMKSGMLRFRLSSGAVVTLTGPADVQLIDPMRLRVARGQLTADVGDDAKGFTVETAQTHVVDLGTKFGVEVADSGHTDVVVFQGKVELFDQRTIKRGAEPMAQLIEGEAVRVDEQRELSRIANVTSGLRDEEWSTSEVNRASTVISSVQDNLHDPRARYFYRIIRGGMQEDAQAFIAKRHEWNGRDAAGMPAWLIGADLVQTFGAGKANIGLEMTVTLARPAVVYVFVDDRNPPPTWLTERFTNTGAKIALENAPSLESGIPLGKGPGVGDGNLAPFAVWKREMPEGGAVTLGAPPAAPEGKPHWMYGIAAKAL